MIHEARLQAHVDYYRSIKKEPLNKTSARKVALTKEQYLQVPASWCMSHRSAWSRIMDRYLDPAYIAKHDQGKRKRALRTSATHHQGSHNLPAFKRALEVAHPDVPVSEFGAWAVSHMGPVKSSVVFNPDATAQAYSDHVEAVRALHGSDHNLSTEPLETEVIVRLGQGRKHERLWIADGADSSSSAPSVSDVRARSTARSLPIRARPTPILSRVDELQPKLAETRETQVHLTAELEATKKQMADMYQIMQTIGQASGVQVQLPAPARHFTPPLSAGSNNPATVSPAATRVRGATPAVSVAAVGMLNFVMLNL
ncbi:uncharacterized protein [Miscanthus floridulus]|uniref:uncharacterized protein n=1 Tax=Miscanthus floridulus TaxID=154761 RepID=UPI003457544D